MGKTEESQKMVLKDTNLKANHNSALQIASHSTVAKDLKSKMNHYE